MHGIEVIKQNGQDISVFNFVGLHTIEEFEKMAELSREYIKGCKPMSVFSIMNLEDTVIDSNIKDILQRWMNFAKGYIRWNVIIGVDPVKKMMLNSLLTVSNRIDLINMRTKDQALEWLGTRLQE